jgi:cyclopropane-fatty-acyl-phospholipid synthase
MDGQRDDILRVLRAHYGADEAGRWFQRWRMFFMACSELFGFHAGEEWGVSHLRFRAP